MLSIRLSSFGFVNKDFIEKMIFIKSMVKQLN